VCKTPGYVAHITCTRLIIGPLCGDCNGLKEDIWHHLNSWSSGSSAVWCITPYECLCSAWRSLGERPGERRKTPYSLDINLITTRLNIAANRRVLNRLSYSTLRIGLTTSRCASLRHARDLSSIFSKILSTFNQDHHCFVAECCTHFPQRLVWERKKKLKLGLKLGKELKRISSKYGHICSGFFLTPSPTSPRYANLTSIKIDLQY